MGKYINKLCICTLVLGMFMIAHAAYAQSETNNVVLLWQADSYTPPFYKGKTLHTAESDITLLAIPYIVAGGSRIPAGSLTFTWERDGVVLGSLSGLGRDTLTLNGTVLTRPINITVTVTAQNSSVSVSQTAHIPIAEPHIQLYERDPLLGILFERALTNTFTMQEEEVTIETFPYFFSTRDRFDSLKHEWRAGGAPLESAAGASVTLRQGENSGRTTISVDIQNPFTFLESVSKNLTITFGN